MQIVTNNAEVRQSHEYKTAHSTKNSGQYATAVEARKLSLKHPETTKNAHSGAHAFQEATSSFHSQQYSAAQRSSQSATRAVP